MDKRDIILRCLYETWPNEVPMIGDDLVTQIVDDVLRGQEPEVRTALGGFNFDLAPYIDTIIGGAILLVALLQYIHTITGDHTKEDLAEEELIKIIVKYLEQEWNMKAGMATKLARVIWKKLRRQQ